MPQSINFKLDQILAIERDINFKPSSTIKLYDKHILHETFFFNGPILIVLTNKFTTLLLFEALSKVKLKILLTMLYYLKTLVIHSYMLDTS